MKKSNLAHPDARFQVFFDGKCPLCRREIEMIGRKDKQNQLLLTDISTSGFHLPERSLQKLMSEIHGRLPDGSFVTGVDVFREIYSRIGYRRLVGFSKFFGVRHVLSAGYFVFAKLRFMHAKHRMAKQINSCDTGSCNPIIPFKSTKAKDR